MTTSSRFSEVLSSLVEGRPRAQLVALGEPMHGSDDLLRVRNEVIADLVVHHGFRSIAIESDFHAAHVVNDLIHGRTSDIDRACAEGISHGFGANRATRELLSWLRTTNSGLDAPVRFYGFDGPMETEAAPSPRSYILRVHAALAKRGRRLPVSVEEIAALAGGAARWTNPAAMYHPEQSVGRSADADRLRVVIDDLSALLEASLPALSPEGRFGLSACARSAAGLARYHAIMATDAPERLSRLIAQRDVMMADNLAAIARREAGRGRTIVFAHNQHLRRERSTMQMGSHELSWYGGGVGAEARLGGGYLFIAMALGAAPYAGLGEPAPGTFEGDLFRTQRTNTAVYPSEALIGPLSRAAQRTDRDARGAYFPLDVTSFGDADGVLFVREIQR